MLGKFGSTTNAFPLRMEVTVASMPPLRLTQNIPSFRHWPNQLAAKGKSYTANYQTDCNRLKPLWHENRLGRFERKLNPDRPLRPHRDCFSGAREARR